jgi:hypothetical protein
MPTKILLNICYGGFSLSDTVKDQYNTATAHVVKPEHWYMDQDVRRDDPILIQIVESAGLVAAGGRFSKLAIVEIPDDVPVDGWIIQEYDGIEWVAEKHRTWRHRVCVGGYHAVSVTSDATLSNTPLEIKHL